ncbi:MAG: outer membrane beta-barrel protein [Candidatus Korobacteraceae bacterium]
MKTINTLLHKSIAIAIGSLLLALIVPVKQGCAQAQPGQSEAQANVAKLNAASTDAPAADLGGSTVAPPTQTSSAVAAESTAAIAKELEVMKLRIQQLESQLSDRTAAEHAPMADLVASPPDPVPNVAPAPKTILGFYSPASRQQNESASQGAAPAPQDPTEPFAYADWTWLNGNSREKDKPWDSKFFTPEIRFDTNYIFDFNHPRDDTVGGSTEVFRSMEVQVEQISFGGDFHWNNVRGRVLTMNGMFAVTTPRNDASTARGQWFLAGAYRYVSEAWGGYHFDVNHGLNIDAGIFVSYIGLFSYYNFDNWAYQPSYVSSNTPWFFNGIRIQWFPTDKLKIEPWIINGWQSYGRYGSKPGLGGQILWRPKPWISLVFNNYGMGEDTLGTGNGQFGRSRIHTDDSVQVKYYDRPGNFLDKMAFSFTGDLGCEYGGPPGQNVNCHHNTATSYKQSFAGWMAYNRWWFKNDHYAFTLGGGAMDNPGRYLTLLPPINGAVAYTGTPYFTENPGDPFKAWDVSATFDYMPKQWITFLWEYGYRHANVPYWTGRGGITPPDGNTGGQGVFGGENSGGGALVPGTTFVPGPTLSATPGYTCVAGATGWCPDLRKDEQSLRMAIMVMF